MWQENSTTPLSTPAKPHPSHSVTSKLSILNSLFDILLHILHPAVMNCGPRNIMHRMLLLLCLSCLVVTWPLPLAAQGEQPADISMTMNDVHLENILQMFGALLQKDVQVAEGIDISKIKISLQVVEIPWDVLLKDILEPYGLTVREPKKGSEVYLIDKQQPRPALLSKEELLKHADPDISDPDRKQLELSVQDLGATKHKKRTDAADKLLTLGPKAIPALVKALSSEDPETRLGSRDVLRHIQHRIMTNKIDNIPALKQTSGPKAKQDK